MPFELTPEQETVRLIAREFAQREIIPHRKLLTERDEDDLPPEKESRYNVSKL